MTLPARIDDLPDLPVAGVLPALDAALRKRGAAVLTAAPGAGKTTLVPLWLAGSRAGRVVMLEPRRVAARGAAERMAALIGEAPGQTVGYRMRGETRISRTTRIEVVTEGILTRMLQDDPALDGVTTVIFDEFHERSLAADLGLALALEARAALRPELELVVMSATLDAAPVAALLGEAPVIEAPGRSFPVETIHLDRPWKAAGAGARLETAMAGRILEALAAHDGGLLAFLPGEAEIRRTMAALEGRLPAGVEMRPLYGALPFAEQRRAIAPAGPSRRKVVLATAIAETSLTIEDVRIVVDSGLARRARHDAASGMSRLVTERVTRAEADQRRGRAGRVAPGWCYRLWTRGEETGLSPAPPPEIAIADLAGLALELAAWGARDAATLAFLTPPPEGPLAEARRLLADLGALDGQGAITAHGRAMAGLPLHPRLAHMLLTAGPAAAPLAAALDAGLRPAPHEGIDLAPLLARLARGQEKGGAARLAARQAERLAGLARKAGAEGAFPPLSPAQMLALAYPDRIARRRPGERPAWLLSGGRGATCDPADPLAGAEWLVIADLDGGGREARIRTALATTEAEIRAVSADRIKTVPVAEWDRRQRSVRPRIEERLGAVVLASRPWIDCPADHRAAALLDGVRDLGLSVLNWTPAAISLRDRVGWLRAHGGPDWETLPEMSDAALADRLEDWLAPLAAQSADFAALCAADLAPWLAAWLGHATVRAIDAAAPPVFRAPTGMRLPIDYASHPPAIAVRLQEMFGVTDHPCLAGGRVRLAVTLLSPARRPLQTTTDLPAFWTGSYADVRREMRGRYPKHPWPENPAEAAPTTRAKPRGQKR